jgi:hypothetical protein
MWNMYEGIGNKAEHSLSQQDWGDWSPYSLATAFERLHYQVNESLGTLQNQSG